MTVRPLLWPASLLLFSACERTDTVRHYTAPKPEAPAVTPMSRPEPKADPHAGLMPAFTAPDLTDTPPAGWVREPTPPRVENLIRAYHVPGDQVAGKSLLLCFPPGTGSLSTFAEYMLPTVDVSNLTREDVNNRITSKTVGGKTIEFLTLTGGDPSAQRTAYGAAWNTPDAVYFALLSWPGGEEAAVRDQFHQWLGSFEARTLTTTAQPPSQAPDTPAVPAATGPVSPPDGVAAWKVPAEWTAGPAKSMRAATLLLPGTADTSFAVIVSVFPGDLGGPLPNVNRWLKELGAPAVASEAEAIAFSKPLDLNKLEGSHYALDGSAKSSRILWIKHGGKSWFFKMIGETALIKREEARFEEFARSLSF